MSKKNKRNASQKQSKGKDCPEPFASLIDLAGGFVMSNIADHMEKKYHYNARGKINPYDVSAFGISTGLIKDSKDIAKTGAILSMMGAFDSNDSSGKKSVRRTSSSNFETSAADYGKKYEEASEEVDESTDKKYEWRDYRIDGWDYDVDPDDFETEEEFEEALEEAREFEDDDFF